MMDDAMWGTERMRAPTIKRSLQFSLNLRFEDLGSRIDGWDEMPG